MLDPPNDAVSVALRSDVTKPAVAVKTAVADPEGTVTVPDTIKREGALLVRETLAPSVPACLESVNVHVVELAEARLVLAHCSEEIVLAVAVTVSPADALELPTVAETVTF